MYRNNIISQNKKLFWFPIFFSTTSDQRCHRSDGLSSFKSSQSQKKYSYETKKILKISNLSITYYRCNMYLIAYNAIDDSS